MRALLILSIFSIASASVPAPIKKVVAKENKKCVFPDDSENFEFIKLGKKNQNLRACKKKCENNDECVAMQYIPPRQCTLYYTDIEQVSVSCTHHRQHSFNVNVVSSSLFSLVIKYKIIIDGQCERPCSRYH
jgi:hypothetical protein